MSGYLVDTNVVSELRKRERADAGVRRWFDACDSDDLFLSVLVLGELRRGIELIRRRDEKAARSLERWIRKLERDYDDRVIPVTLSICDRWGRLGLEQPLPPIDGLLIATAIDHRLTFVTRNPPRASIPGADLINPFDS